MDKPTSSPAPAEPDKPADTADTGNKAPDPTKEGPGLHPIKLDPKTGAPLPPEEHEDKQPEK